MDDLIKRLMETNEKAADVTHKHFVYIAVLLFFSLCANGYLFVKMTSNPYSLTIEQNNDNADNNKVLKG